ncbi:DUF1292 domain-containing protein [Myxococcota bacterium]|nr:DUF1292 domain-containing protein [Myxococcota bacterium]
MADQHDHEHGHEDDEGEDVVILEDDEGNEHEFTVEHVLRVGDHDYVILVPVDPDAAGEEGMILRVETTDDGESTLVDIEDEAEFNRVAEAWEKLQEEEGDDEDDEDDEE